MYCGRLYDVVLQAADPNQRDHELAAGGTYHGALLNQHRCLDASRDALNWLTCSGAYCDQQYVFVRLVGAQLLSEQQLGYASENWLYQQIESSLTPALTNLKLRELELVYLLAAFDGRLGANATDNNNGAATSFSPLARM